ncbi:MAG: XTP/dITP diphosphatase [Chloroflexi bacterium]|nr:XTP/dITP diphosphatase [Chloroflexota bacterium]
MKRLLIATHNPGKVREYRQLLRDLPLELTYLDEVGITEEVEETGQTFLENAIQKAMGYAELSGMLTLADDSGLEVDALGGAPGVHSSRYAGPGASDQERIDKLLRELEGVPEEERTARFRCVIAVATPDGRLCAAQGTVEGIITESPRGEHGFGYDPIFYLPDKGRTMAELLPEEKNRISHRARAAHAIKPLLKSCGEEGTTNE